MPGVIARFFGVLRILRVPRLAILVVGAVICITTIYFVLDSKFTHPRPKPTSAVVSDVSARSFNVVVTFQAPAPLCAVAVTVIPPFVSFRCSHTLRDIHRLSFSGLYPRMPYVVLVGYGTSWWVRAPAHASSLQGTTQTVRFLATTTRAKDFLPAEPTWLLVGTVVDAVGVPVPDAVVTAQVGQRNLFFSTTTNRFGGYLMSIPLSSIPPKGATPDDDAATILVRKDGKETSVVQSLSRVSRIPQEMTLELVQR